MKLYKVSRTDVVAYDEYDSAIIAAPNELTARYTNPSPHSLWYAPHESLKIELIGEAAPDILQGVVLASFNAG